MKLTTYRVLIDGEIGRLPLASMEDTEGTGNQEFCGYGYEGDFTNAENNGRGGEVWEFVTYSETAMEQALNSDSAVIVYTSRPGLLVS